MLPSVSLTLCHFVRFMSKLKFFIFVDGLNPAIQITMQTDWYQSAVAGIDFVRFDCAGRMWFIAVLDPMRTGVKKMQFGVQVNVYRTSWEEVRATVEAMEAGNWDSLWFADHFIPPGANREQESLTAFEGFSAISAVAGMTRKLRLGPLVV